MNNSNKNNELNYLKLIKDNIDNKVFIITKNDCPLCEKLKQLFDTI